MCKLFDDWSIEVENYCQNNGLNFEKAKKLSQCWSKNDLILQYYDDTKKSNGLLDETPMPVVLIIEKTQKGLVFTETEYTEKYLRRT